LRVGTRIALLEAGRLVTAQARAEFLNSSEPLVMAYKTAFDETLH